MNATFHSFQSVITYTVYITESRALLPSVFLLLFISPLSAPCQPMPLPNCSVQTVPLHTLCSFVTAIFDFVANCDLSLCFRTTSSAILLFVPSLGFLSPPALHHPATGSPPALHIPFVLSINCLNKIQSPVSVCNSVLYPSPDINVIKQTHIHSSQHYNMSNER